MQTAFEMGDRVRVVRNVRNDGTYPGLDNGDFLIRRGSTGVVESIGTFLQDQIVYGVFFWDERRLVGCREPELIAADDPWTPSRFETRERVTAAKSLAVGGEVVVPMGERGEVLQVIRDAEPEVAYHVRFPGRTLQVPEGALDMACDTGQAAATQTEGEV